MRQKMEKQKPETQNPKSRTPPFRRLTCCFQQPEWWRVDKCRHKRNKSMVLLRSVFLSGDVLDTFLGWKWKKNNQKRCNDACAFFS